MRKRGQHQIFETKSHIDQIDTCHKLIVTSRHNLILDPTCVVSLSIPNSLLFCPLTLSTNQQPTAKKSTIVQIYNIMQLQSNNFLAAPYLLMVKSPNFDKMWIIDKFIQIWFIAILFNLRASSYEFSIVSLAMTHFEIDSWYIYI